MTTNSRRWLSGLMSAFFSGAAGTLGMIAVEPEHFNVQYPDKLALAAAVTGCVGLVNYLAKSPLPTSEE